MIATVLPLGTLLILGVVLLIAHIEDIRSKARRVRQLRADDKSIEAFNDQREALR